MYVYNTVHNLGQNNIEPNRGNSTEQNTFFKKPVILQCCWKPPPPQLLENTEVLTLEVNFEAEKWQHERLTV